MESWCNGIRATGMWPVPFPFHFLSIAIPRGNLFGSMCLHLWWYTTNYHELYRKARFARVRAARGLTQVYCRTPGALPYQPHPLDPLSLPILAVGVHLLYVCMYVCMYVLQGNFSLLFRLGQTKCGVIITTYIVLVSFRPGQKSTCFSVKNTLDW